MTYEKIRKLLQTGDEVICGGKGFFSRLIQLVTWSWTSHVGKIFVDDSGVWIWHSTSLSKGKSGPQREQFRTWLKRYNGRVEIRRLKYVDHDYEWRPEGLHDTYVKTIREFKDREYEDNKLELAGAAMLWRNKPNLATIFCSEMCAEIDMRTGILKRDMPANEYTPADSLAGGKKDKNITGVAYYLRPIRLK